MSRRDALRVLGAVTAVTAVGTGCARSSAQSADATPMTVGEWEREFTAEPTRDYYMQRAASPESKGYYELAYGIDAYTMMYEATASDAYLDTALQFVEAMMSQARPSEAFPTSRYRDRYLTWISMDPDVAGQEVPLYESYCWRYVFRALRVMRTGGLLAGDPAWQRRHDAILAFGEQNVFDKWYTRGTDDNIYASRTHMASHWAFIATALEELTSDVERSTRCRKIYEAIDTQLPNFPSSLRGQLGPSPSDSEAYDWSDVWAERTPSQDVSHGNNVVSYIVEAHDRGREWTDDDVRSLVRTLGVMWPAGEETVAEFVDGSGQGDGWLSDGWVKLGRYDLLLQQRLQGHGVRDAQFLGAMALNAWRLTGTRGA